jgi:hypothetical protein
MLLESVWFLPVAGMLAGLVLGCVARRRHFCTLMALERHWYAGESDGLRSWVLAAATALVLTQLFGSPMSSPSTTPSTSRPGSA